MTRTGHLLIADFRKSAIGSDVQDLVAKLQRRGFWTTLLDPGSPLPAGAAGLAILLDGRADRSQALRTMSSQAQSAGVPVVAWLDGADSSKVSGHLPSSVILVQGRDASHDRVLSRFANAIANAGSERMTPTGMEHSAEAGQVAFEPGQSDRAEAVWSWPGAMLGPLWPVAAGRPLAGFLGLALLILGTVAAASLARSPLAPLIGFVAAWLTFAVLMGLFAGERAPGQAEERWFRPLGVLALGVVVGFVALVGWSKAQIERTVLQPQLAGSMGNTVLVGRQPSNWNWDASWMSAIGELPFKIGGEVLPGIEGDITPIKTETGVPLVVPTAQPTSNDQPSCNELRQQNAGKQSETIEFKIFCGDQDGKPPA